MDKFRLIAITLPDETVEGESDKLIQLLDNGVERVHIRKPSWSLRRTKDLICSLPSDYHTRLTLHDHHILALDYECGVQTNARNPQAPLGVAVVSHSCHELNESRLPNLSYATISPVYDSISKPGYRGSAELIEVVRNAEKDIYPPLIALGGITFDKLTELREAGFAGAAMIGAIWNNFSFALNKIKALCCNS